MKLTFLRPLYGCGEDHVSVYLDTSRAHENAQEAVGLRWRAARESLAGAGAGERTLDAVEAVVTDPALAAPGRAVFGCAGAVRFTSPLSHPPRREIARFAPLPHLMPLLAQQPPATPHLRVIADRAGGEILAVTGAGVVSAEESSGRRWPVHKTSSGGWSQARFQRSTEETWEENARELAAAVADAAKRAQAELVVLGGDVRARSLLRDHLPAPLAGATVLVEQEVAVDSEAMAQAAESAVAARAENEARQRFDRWRAQREDSGAAEGLADTLAALRDGRVADLFVVDRPTSTATVWIGPDGAGLAAGEAELRERGIAEPVRDRADAAIVRALVFTDAELHFLPEDLVADGPGDGTESPRDGICATLRWADGR